MIFPLHAVDFNNLVTVIITLAVLGFSVLSQILSDRNKKGQPQQRNAAAPRPQQPSIESEIEEFLRQARGDAGSSRPAASSRNQPLDVAPIEVEPWEDEPMVEPGRGFGQSLSDHVRDHVQRDSISQRDAGLASATESADERIERHLEDVFEHEVGHIAHVEELNYDVSEGTDASTWEDKSTQNVPPIAGEIADMMQSPDTVRKMFVMTEILKRPDI